MRCETCDIVRSCYWLIIFILYFPCGDIQGCDTVFVTSTGRTIDLAMAWIMVRTFSSYVFSRDCQMILVGCNVAICNV